MRPLFRPRFERLEDRRVPTVGVTAGFAGLDFNASGGSEPPDTDVAAGPAYLVETVNTTLAFYSKSSGANVFAQDFSSFFTPVKAGPIADMFDPRVVYDDTASRFIVSIDEENDSSKTSFFDFAVSNDSDPTQGFTEMHRLNVKEPGPGGTGLWADYPQIGFNADAVVFTFNMYQFPSPTGAFDHVLVIDVNKSSVLDANNATLTFSMNDRNNPNDGSLAPASMHGATPGLPMWLVEEDDGSSTLRFVEITNVLSATPTYTDFVVTVPAYSPVVPPKQPNGMTITTVIDSSILSIAYRNDNLVLAQNVGSGGVTVARWYHFNVSGPTPVMAEYGQIDRGPGVFTYFPSIDLNVNADMAMTFLESSATELMSMYVTARAVSDQPGTMEPPVLVQGGQTNYTGNRAGDFSGTSVDPIDGTFWTANEFSNQESTNWGTWIAHVVPNVTPIAIANLSFTPAVEGQPGNLMGTFNDPTAGQAHTVTVYWGDGSARQFFSFAAGVSSFGPFGHAYPEETAAGSPFQAQVTVNNFAGSSGLMEFPITIADSSISAAGVSITTSAQLPYSGVVASLSDTNPGGQPGDFSATVTWGDGHVSPGTIAPNGSGGFRVFGTNTYSTMGTYPVSVQIADVGGAKTSANSTFVLRKPNIFAVGAGPGGGPDVRIYDAYSGVLVRDFYAYAPQFLGGVRTAIGNVTGNGIPDIITAPGPGGGPDIRVFDPVTGALIREFYAYDPRFLGGVYVAAGDLNADGYADIVTGADAGGGPQVTAFSGKDLSVLRTFYAYNAGFTGGVRVAVGDVNGDGFADIITAAGPGGGPHVQVFSGRDGSILQSFYAYASSFAGGVYVAAGDVNGDGKADIITGAGAGGGPQVEVFDGTNVGNVLQSFYAYNPSFTGGVTVAALTGASSDGVAQIITGAGPGGGPNVVVRDGLSLATLDNFYAFNSQFAGGVYVGSA